MFEQSTVQFLPTYDVIRYWSSAKPVLVRSVRGLNGLNGLNGLDGPNGLKGLKGLNGQDGLNGLNVHVRLGRLDWKLEWTGLEKESCVMWSHVSSRILFYSLVKKQVKQRSTLE